MSAPEGIDEPRRTNFASLRWDSAWLDPAIRRMAEEAAQAAGLSVEDWVERAIRRTCNMPSASRPTFRPDLPPADVKSFSALRNTPGSEVPRRTLTAAEPVSPPVPLRPPEPLPLSQRIDIGPPIEPVERQVEKNRPGSAMFWAVAIAAILAVAAVAALRDPNLLPRIYHDISNSRGSSSESSSSADLPPVSALDRPVTAPASPSASFAVTPAPNLGPDLATATGNPSPGVGTTAVPPRTSPPAYVPPQYNPPKNNPPQTAMMAPVPPPTPAPPSPPPAVSPSTPMPAPAAAAAPAPMEMTPAPTLVPAPPSVTQAAISPAPASTYNATPSYTPPASPPPAASPPVAQSAPNPPAAAEPSPPTPAKSTPAETAELAKLVPALEQRAKTGDAAAMYRLGVLYVLGKGVTRDYEHAAKLLRQAADSGLADAQYDLGVLCDKGLGVAKDSVEAARWYAKAAAQGHPPAALNLGYSYAEGLGVQKNLTEAARWFRRAAESGLVNAQYNLAYLYEQGAGVNKSPLDAYAWYSVAAQRGDRGAQEALDRIAAGLSSKDLAAARGKATALKKTVKTQG